MQGGNILTSKRCREKLGDQDEKILYVASQTVICPEPDTRPARYSRPFLWPLLWGFPLRPSRPPLKEEKTLIYPLAGLPHNYNTYPMTKTGMLHTYTSKGVVRDNFIRVIFTLVSAYIR